MYNNTGETTSPKFITASADSTLKVNERKREVREEEVKGVRGVRG
jgi:hypothetical protein